MADAHAAAHDAPPELRHHFVDMEAQKEASTLGMWIFLVTEVLFFGGMFLAYVIYRAAYTRAFEGASNMLDLKLGAFNTVVLILSSLTMALAVWAGQQGRKNLIILFLFATILLGGVFLGVKAIEYKQKFVHHEVPGPHFVVPIDEETHKPLPRQSEMFFSLYFCMTGLHALHMIIGIGLLLWLIRRARRGDFTARYNTPVDMVGLYWHFVDIVWIFSSRCSTCSGGTRCEPQRNAHRIARRLLCRLRSADGLTALTLWAAYQHLGIWNTPVALAIATTKAALVALIFMHLRYSPRLTPLRRRIERRLARDPDRRHPLGLPDAGLASDLRSLGPEAGRGARRHRGQQHRHAGSAPSRRGPAARNSLRERGFRGRPRSPCPRPEWCR